MIKLIKRFKQIQTDWENITRYRSNKAISQSIYIPSKVPPLGHPDLRVPGTNWQQLQLEVEEMFFYRDTESLFNRTLGISLIDINQVESIS